jgi:hypothetical protein
MIDTMIRLRVGYNLQEYFLVLIKNASIVILHSTPLQIKQDEGIQGIRGVRTRSNLLLLFLFLRMEDSSMVVHLILELLHVALRRYLAIASSVSAVWSKASVGLFETLVARMNTQLLFYVEFVPVVVDPVVFVGRKAVYNRLFRSNCCHGLFFGVLAGCAKPAEEN